MKAIFSSKRKWFKLGVCFAIVIVGIGVLLLGVGDRGGKKAWKRARSALETDGISLEIAAHSRSPVPDEENFFAVPLLRDLAVVTASKTEEQRVEEIRQRLANSWVLGHKFRQNGRHFGDLKQWRDHLKDHQVTISQTDDPASDILATMEPYQDIFSELADALDRPHSQFIPDLAGRLKGEDAFTISRAKPGYSQWIRSLTFLLRLRAIAAARNGDPEMAVDSLRMINRLAEACGNDSLFKALMIRSSLLKTLKLAVSEFLSIRSADAAQLRILQEDLGRINVEESYIPAMKTEMVLAIRYLESSKKKPTNQLTMELTSFAQKSIPLGLGALPDGWLDGNKAAYIDYFREFVLAQPSFDELDFQKTAAGIKELKNRGWLPLDTLAAAAIFPSIDRNISILRQSEILLIQMQTACALERHFLTSGAYPESLEELAPAFMSSVPLDPFDGQPLRYEKNEDGGFLLYSIGIDQADNGGVANTQPVHRFVPGVDWVWEQ